VGVSQPGGRRGPPAKIAGIHTRALYNKMKRLGLQKENFRAKNRPENDGHAERT
jgi:DNA-binding NtrC family response regulator